MNIGEYLKKIRKIRNLSATEVAGKLGVSKSTMSNYEKGIRMPSIEALKKLSEIYSVSIEQIITGDNFNAVDLDFKYKKIPVLGVIRAGEPIFAEENILGYTDLSAEYCNGSDEYFALYVIGDSMNNSLIFEGDIVVARSQDIVDNGDIAVVLIDNEEATIKKFFQNENIVTLMPSSSNPIYKPRSFNIKNTPINVIGKVVEVKRKL